MKHQHRTFGGLKKTAGLLTAALSAAVLLSGCGSSGPRDLISSIQQGQVVLGSKYDQAGMGMREPDKTMTGLDVDIAQYVVETIATENGWAMPKITWKETPSAQRETLLKNGEVDMITATYSINAGRAKAVDFGGPYLVTHQALLIRDDDASITSLKDLKPGMKLCSVTGSTPAQKVKQALPHLQLQEFDSYASCVEALHQKKVDAMTTDATILYGYSMQYPGEFKIIPLVKDDGKPFTNEYYGIGVAKGSTNTVTAVNNAIEKMYSSGKFAELVHKNLGDDITIEPAGTGGSALIEEGNAGDLSFLNQK